MRIGVFTSSRADYGLLEPVIKAIYEDDRFDMCLFVSGTHMSPEYGETYTDIVYPVTHTSEIVMAHDTPSAMTKSFGLAMMQYGEALKLWGPLDIMLLLGDRYESLAMALSCHIYGTAIAHISGGEETQGSLDNGFRFCISRLAHLHFVYCNSYRNHLIQLGENPNMVHDIGLLALAGMDNDPECFPPFRSGIIVIVHPPALWIDNLLSALPKNRYIHFIRPNMDAGSHEIWAKMKKYQGITGYDCYNNLYRAEFLELLRRTRFIIGNSSAGIYEAPALGTPTINIGDRQKGRLQADSIIDCGGTEKEIKAAVDLLKTWELSEWANPFQKKDSVGIIIEKLLEFKPYQKEFYGQPTL